MIADVRIEVLETARLRLRPPASEDAEDLTRLLQDPEIHRWTSSIPYPYTIDDARRFLSMRAEADLTGDSFVWSITDRHSGQLMGAIGLHDIDRERGRVEMGYWIGEEFRGQGYTSEAAVRVVSWAFERVNATRIQATHMPGNEPSAKVMRKAGMQEEGLLRKYGYKNGENVDLYLFAVLREDDSWIPTVAQTGEGR